MFLKYDVCEFTYSNNDDTVFNKIFNKFLYMQYLIQDYENIIIKENICYMLVKGYLAHILLVIIWYS
jgi:hypothetical protein